MIGTRFAVAVFALLLSACGSNASDAGSAPPSGRVCSPNDSCFDQCLCGGGVAGACAAKCAAVTAPAADAGSGVPGEMVKTVVGTPFDVPVGAEYYRCQNFENPFGADVAIVATESFMTQGAHHMFVFQTAASENTPLETCSGLEFSSYLHLAQTSQAKTVYPQGVGRVVPATTGIRLQLHFLNSSPNAVHAEVAVTFHAVPMDAIAIPAGQLFMNTLGINVAPFSQGTAGSSCGIPHDISLFTAVSHMHQHGTHFVGRVSNGQLLYETNEWAEPAPWGFSPAVHVPGGSTVDIACDYQNYTSATLSFGESAATDEMCIFAADYYPAFFGEGINCGVL